MRLLFLHSISTGSGANVHIQEFTESARKLDTEVRCMGQAVQSIEVKGKRVRLPIPQIFKDLVYLTRNRGYANQALQIAREFSPDAVYFRGAPFMSYGREVANKLGLPLFYELNAPYPDEHVQFHGGQLEMIAKRIEAANRFEARKIFVVSRQLAAILESNGVPQEKIVVVPNAVRLESFDVSVRPSDKTVRFGFVGSLQVWHGIEVLLDAFETVLAEVPNAVLEIVGTGPQADWLVERMEQSNCNERIVWHGSKASRDIPDFLQRMDVLLAPYPPLPQFYFSPLKLFEYLGSGRAIVASQIGQIADVLTDGLNGRLLPPGDASALAQCCVELARDPDQRKALGIGARKTAQSHTWDENASSILGHIQAKLREAQS